MVVGWQGRHSPVFGTALIIIQQKKTDKNPEPETYPQFRQRNSFFDTETKNLLKSTAGPSPIPSPPRVLSPPKMTLNWTKLLPHLAPEKQFCQGEKIIPV